jgi:para-aminobenzoate synthetase component 1
MKLQLTYAQTPHALFSPLLGKAQPVLLHSADKSNRFGRYDVLSADPVQRVQWTKGYMTVGEHRLATADPLHTLGEQQDSFCQQLKTNADLESVTPPFSAGFLGYFGYPLHQSLEQQQPAPTDPTGLPELQGGFYDWSIVTDHWRRTTCLVTDTKARQQQVLAWLDEPKIEAIPNQMLGLLPSSTNADYQAAFDQVQDYLAAGDCYQVNLAQHFCAKFTGDPWQLYQHWCQQQAAPFSAYLDFSTPGDDPTVLLSLSPERFLEIENRRATVCPIKGTAARGLDAKQDDELAAQLRASDKELAENLMIVDLLRNDLGRICDIGSVEVTHLFELLKFSNVQHLVSTITGNLSSATSVMQAFKALFPSGSITGAPKIRAIDIINELEPVGRSVYSGSIGYWDRSGRFDSNVAIRTGLVTNGQAHLWGGGAIVADSSCDAELREIQQKVGRLLTT